MTIERSYICMNDCVDREGSPHYLFRERKGSGGLKFEWLCTEEFVDCLVCIEMCVSWVAVDLRCTEIPKSQLASTSPYERERVEQALVLLEDEERCR